MWNKHFILQLKCTCWGFECPFSALLLLFSVDSGVCGAEGGGISAFYGLYSVQRDARKCKITPEVATYGFYCTNILIKNDAFQENKHCDCIS